MENTLTDDRRQDLFATSTHVGHHWRDSYYFPSQNFERVLNQPIPPSLNRDDEVKPEVFYETTHKQYHDNKYPYQGIYNEAVGLRQIKPIPSYKVNYLADVVERLNAKPRRPLTMAFQGSEYKTEFEDKTNEATSEFDRKTSKGSQDFFLRDELTAGPTRIMADGGIRPSVPTRKFDPSEAGVLDLLDPYLTSYNKEHKKWKPSEWKGIAKKDAVTIYDTEEYTKSGLGFGTKINPVAKNEYDLEKQPMRDAIWFKSDTKLRQIHQPTKRVPYTGLVTENQENYKAPSDIKMKEIKHCPIETPFTLPSCDSKTIYATSSMYKTESMNIGSGKLVTVPDMKSTNY